MRKLFAAALIAATFAGAQASAGVIISQDFENVTDPGNPGFYTEYSYRSGAQNTGANSMYDEGTWTIATNPNDVHNLWIDDDFASKKLILNGKSQAPGDPNTTAWQQQAGGVGPGTFSFSIDVFDVCCIPGFSGNADSILTFDYQVDGGAFVNITGVTTHVTPLNFSEGGFDGYRLSGTFLIPDFNPKPGTLQVSVRSWNGAPGGNDFAVDNISIATVPEPGTWALMIMGFGAAGAMLRQRRRALA